MLEAHIFTITAWKVLLETWPGRHAEGMAQVAWKSLGRGLVPGGLAALKAVLTPVCASEEPTVEVPAS